MEFKSNNKKKKLKFESKLLIFFKDYGLDLLKVNRLFALQLNFPPSLVNVAKMKLKKEKKK